MRHESFCLVQWKTGYQYDGVPTGICQKQGFGSEAPCPSFSLHQKLSGHGSTLCMSDHTNNKGWKDDLMVKKENTSVGPSKCTGQKSSQKDFCLCWVRFQGHFGHHLQIPKDQCLRAVQGAISSDRFVSSLQVIELSYKITDNTGVSDEIGGVKCSRSARDSAKDSIQNLSNYLTCIKINVQNQACSHCQSYLLTFDRGWF